MQKSKIDPMVYRLHATTAEYRQREARLFALLRRELGPNCYVSFSAGKDSSVVAHAAHAVMPGIPILKSDSGCPFSWLESERQQWVAYAKANGWNLLLFPWDKWSQSTRDAGDDALEHQRRVHSTQFAAIESWGKAHGRTRRVTGIRAAESVRRKMSIRLGFGASANHLSPIGTWDEDDVWAYIIKHGLPWLSIYDYCGPSTRNGLIGKNGSEFGRLAFLKLYYPEAYRLARTLFSADDLR
jgi:3'-phosphoadenosine 5'-phosphosulfate sulfotransferase (PAPS reductase)/FAD synthetase